MYFRAMILVTGGTGLVGSHLLYHLLKENDTVKAIYRKSSDRDHVKHVFSYYSAEALYEKIQWVVADITDITSLSKSFKNITHVYHCAALVSFDAADYKQMLKINIEGTANIVNLCIANHIEKLCFVSSVAAIGKSQSDSEITENNEWNVEDNNYGYAISKHGAEMEVWRCSQEGIPVVIVNPGVIIGPGFWHNGSGKLFSKVYAGLPFFTEGKTGFVGVADVVQAMLLLMKGEHMNERYILVSENISFKGILMAIAENLSKKPPAIKIGSLASGIFWRLEWLLSLFGRKPLLTKQAARSSQNNYSYSNAKIKDKLGFEFTPMAEVIAQTSNYYQSDYS